MDIKAWLVLLSIIVFIFGIYQASHAAELGNFEIILDKNTLSKGYTVQSFDKNLSIPFFPNQYQDNLKVRITEIFDFYGLPSKKIAVSDQYIYDIKSGQAGLLTKPVLLSLKFESNNNLNKAVYFFDNYQNKWRPLKTIINYHEKTAQAYTIFPYAKILVLEDVLEKESDMTAASAIVIDKANHDVLFAKGINEVRPVASLTKLVTALVFLDINPGWNTNVVMQESDYVGGATLYVEPGDRLTVKDLFYAMMVASKNNATKALIRATGLTEDQFVQKMNEKVRSMGLKRTYFVEPTGLSERNISTAYEMAKIAEEAFNNWEVLQATTTKQYTTKLLNREQTYPVYNTSEKVLNRDLYITGSKTGYTHEAGYCLVTQAKNYTRELIALVMGAEIRQNYEEVYALLKSNLK